MATAKQQADLNKQLNTTVELQSKIKETLEKQGGLAGKFSKELKDIGAQTAGILDKEIELEKTDGKRARTAKTIVSALEFNVKNMDKIVTGEMEALEMSNLRNEAVKEGNQLMIDQIDFANAIGQKAEFFGNAFQKATAAVDSIGQRIEESSFGFIKTGKATEKLKANMRDVATGKSGIGTLFKGTKLLRIGLAGAAIAAASFALEANKLQRDLGLSLQQTSKILAQSKAVAAVNKANGMTQEDTLAIIKNISTEFGSFSAATTSATLQASNLVANFGLATDSVGTLARQMQAVGADSLESALNSIELQANMARAADVPVGDVMNDVAKNTEFFARFAKNGGANVTAAAIAARKLGLEMSNVASIADSLLDFENSITKQMEAEVLLGRELNLEKARELVFNNDIAGAMAEISNLVSPEEFNQMDAIRRRALAESVGLQADQLSRAISAGGAQGGITTNMRTGGAVAAQGGTDKMDTLIMAVNEGNATLAREIQRQGVN